LIQGLREQRDTGQPYPTTVGQLGLRVNPAATPQDIEKALARQSFAGQVVRARKKDPASPIVLAEDVERLASSALILEYVLGRLCKAEKPVHSPARLVTQVDPGLRAAFSTAIASRLAQKSLPDCVGIQEVKGQAQLYLKAFPPPRPRKHPAEELAEQLLRALEKRRDHGEDYPVFLGQLLAEAAPQAKPALVRQALDRAPFHTQAIAAVAGKKDSPVALVADRERLAASPQLLQYLLSAVTTPRRPLASVASLQELLTADLQVPFAESLRHRFETGALPSSVDFFHTAQGPELFLKERLPQASALAWKMLRRLELHRQQAASEPLTLDVLIQSVDPAATPELAARALKEKVLKPHLILAVPGSPQTPVALAEDAAGLADWPGLLVSVLAAVRTPQDQAVALKDLKKNVAKPLQAAFAASLERRLNAHTLPASVGLLHVKRSPLFFLLADVSTSWPTVPASAPTRAVQEPFSGDDFARCFEEAFDRLDRERGSHNLVSLVGLRAALEVDRATFDAQLGHLRRRGRYSLSAAEGRHGISPEEHHAGIMEDGSLLLFVSRKEEK
jgi:hypothetical protein